MELSDKIWWTRKSKIQTEKRLLSNSLQSQFLLLWYSFLSVSASVYNLKFPAAESMQIVWIATSIWVLVISGYITGLSFKERASLIKESYQALQKLYELSKLPSSDQVELLEEYEKTLNLCENHKEIDYYTALCQEYLLASKGSKNDDIKSRLNRLPTPYVWISWFSNKLMRITILSFFYALPVATFVFFK
ncbi:SLATT domain-containing protein [Gilvimarinus algae]|uniref:SLATT domain-containing protein n=1 Tax=Gilvimarinus algae TaxID=3058037 RepID=A0ABT8TIG0_9GAMM|nr:SLATT domain-containing protein [Gilvimarinus sp. SDUM040014]MDO3382466.1 SLATT domain-containing protein [Gilvimarinus sp. SDUM040014]